MTQLIPNFSELWDQPSSPTTHNYIICCTPRSGSNLLSFTLAKQGLGIPLEYFNFRENPKCSEFFNRICNTELDPYTASIEQKQQYLRELLRKRTTENGIFGLKIFPHHYPENLIETILPEPIQYIWIQRRDFVGQAISFYFAQSLQQWHSKRTASGELPSYSFKDIFEIFTDLKNLQREWFRFFKDRNVNVYQTSFEDLSNDFEATIQNINEFLGFPDLDIPDAPIQKQTHPLKLEFQERFINDITAQKHKRLR